MRKWPAEACRPFPLFHRSADARTPFISSLPFRLQATLTFCISVMNVSRAAKRVKWVRTKLFVRDLDI
jgi:hypothetical protein